MQPGDLSEICLCHFAALADDAQAVRGELAQKTPVRKRGDRRHLVDLLNPVRGNVGAFGDGGE